MAALAGLTPLLAHGGVGGAIVEALLALTVAGLFLAVYLRERRAGRTREDDSEQPLISPQERGVLGQGWKRRPLR